MNNFDDSRAKPAILYRPGTNLYVMLPRAYYDITDDPVTGMELTVIDRSSNLETNEH